MNYIIKIVRKNTKISNLVGALWVNCIESANRKVIASCQILFFKAFKT